MNIDNYINTLYENQNIGADSNQRDLFKREDYLKILKEVLTLLKDNKDLSIEELRNKLYENSHIEDAFKDFFLRQGLAPGAVITYGTKNYQERIIIGNKQEVIERNGILIPQEEKMEEDTLFDLASTTKIFTAICILKLVEDGSLKLNSEFIKYAPQFKNLKGLTILDLLTFEPLEVAEKIDSKEDLEEAEKILFTAKRKSDSNGFGIYNDIAPMALKYVIEKITGLTYYDYLKKEVLDKIGMSSTFVKIPDSRLDSTANSNYDGRYYDDGKYFIRTKATKGISTDDKARILGQPLGILSGHAGLFSSSSDMTKLARALIDNKILRVDIRDEMARNRRGFALIKPDGTKNYAQFFGMLCYSKNPNLPSSEVGHMLSGKSFASAGWSGTQQTIDPLNNINFTLLSNRSHNRMTVIGSSHKSEVHEREDGKRTIILPNGVEMIDATKYAFLRDDVIRKCLILALQYKMLEDITGYSKNNENIETSSKTI